MWDGSAETRTTYYIKSEPPAMAGAYDFKAYPLYHDARPPIDQLTEHNRILHEHERDAILSFKVDWWQPCARNTQSHIPSQITATFTASTHSSTPAKPKPSCTDMSPASSQGSAKNWML